MEAMASAGKPQTTLELDDLLALVDDATASAGITGRVRAAARARAVSLFEACGADDDAMALAALAYAAELLTIVAVDLAADPAQCQRLIGAVDRLAGVPAVALGRELLRAESPLELPPNGAIETRLALLLALTDARSVGLWTQRDDDQLERVGHAGELDAPERSEAERQAGRLLGGEDTGAPLLGARIERLRPPPAALIATGVSAGSRQARLLLDAAGPVLSALLDREALQAYEHATRETVMSSVERRLARLRFDLHDGPQQDIHLLAQDLSLFREQVRPMVAGDPNSDRLLGRLDDLEAQLVALDEDLRRLSSAVQSPFLTAGSLTDALRKLTDAFAARTGVTPETRVTGPLAELTDSQQITLLALIREALSNVRKHSGARHVSISLSADAHGIHVGVTDDGEGFDPETMLARAAGAGRLGLVGMQERVRMLGGRTQIESRPGGPTAISATLAPWPETCGADR